MVEELKNYVKEKIAIEAIIKKEEENYYKQQQILEQWLQENQ